MAAGRRKNVAGLMESKLNQEEINKKGKRKEQFRGSIDVDLIHIPSLIYKNSKDVHFYIKRK